MLQNFWTRIEERLYIFIQPLLVIYIFFQPFNHFAGIRNTAFYTMLLLFLIKTIRKGINIHWKDSTITAFFMFLSAVLISILFSNYLTDSLNAFRKNFLNQSVVFFVILAEFRTAEKLKSLFYTIIFSFVAVTLIIFIKNPPDALFNNILEAKKNKESFLGGYALNAAFYIPFTLGYLFSIKDKIIMRVFLWVMILAEFALVWLYSSRTPLIALLASTVVIILFSKRYKMIAIILIVLLGLGAVSYFKKPELLERYKSLLSFQTYISSAGLSGRYYVWRGAIEMIKARPVIGYGYGWKKITTVAREEGYLDRWRETEPLIYNFYNSGYGKANPHNLALQILFEMGILGLAAFALFWGTVFVKIMKITREETGYELNCFVRYGVLGVLIAYLIVNITNGLWEEAYGILTFTLAAITMVIYEQDRCKNN